MKTTITLTIETGIVALIKDRKDIKNLSNFVENLFKVELGLKPEGDDELSELRIMNAKLSQELDGAKASIRSLSKKLLEKSREKESAPVAVFKS